MNWLRPTPLIVMAVLALAAVLFLLRQRLKPAPPIRPEELAFPVLLLNETNISDVCLNAEELTFRPENTDHIIEQRFHVLDAEGRRYRITDFRHAEKRPSFVSRVLNANVFHVSRFKVAFTLRFDRALSRQEVEAQMQDRTWLRPLPKSPRALSELYIAYRVDRFQEFGNERDRMPDSMSTSRPAPPAKP
jgi:hypothetical protein